MNFFIKMTPPTTTAQEIRVTVIHGIPFSYDPPKVKNARTDLMELLTTHTPARPMDGPLILTTIWYFPKGKNHISGEWRTNRPDTSTAFRKFE